MGKYCLFLLLKLYTLTAFAQGNEDCSEEAKVHFKLIIDAVALGNHTNEIDSSIQNLQKLARRSCISKDSLPSYYAKYFNVQSGQTSDLTEEYRKNWWHQQINLIQFISKSDTTDQLSRAKENLRATFNRVHPQDISILSLNDVDAESSQEKSKTCQPQNSIVDKLPPVRHQGASGWCHLYATADLLSFMTQRNISAAYLSHVLSPKGSGATSSMALNHLTQNFGLCLESTMPSNSPTPEYIQNLQILDKNLVHFINTKQCTGQLELLQTYFQRNIGDIAQLMSRSVSNGKVTDLKIPMFINNNETQYSRTGLVSHLALDQCKKDREDLKLLGSSIELESLNSQAPDAYMKKISEELNKGRPINVSYKFHNMTSGQGGGDHTSTVVGRRLINGQCQLLIRNSWGPTSCTKLVPQSDACHPPGHFWVSASDLYSNVTGVQYAK